MFHLYDVKIFKISKYDLKDFFYEFFCVLIFLKRIILKYILMINSRLLNNSSPRTKKCITDVLSFLMEATFKLDTCYFIYFLHV